MLGKDTSVNWSKIFTELKRCLPFYSTRIWEGRHGLRALAQNDCETVVTLWHSLADKGDPEAQYQLGLLHFSGECLDQNLHETIRLIVRAAKQRHSSARRWLKHAARQGNADAQFGLGQMYLEGAGGPQNSRRARKLLSAAADQGHSEAQVEWGRQNIMGAPFGRLMRIFLGGMLDPNLPKAFDLFEKAANSGNLRGKYYLGLTYEAGQGVSTDYLKAFQLASEAANGGVAMAQLNLARYYWNGEVTKKNRELATQWFDTGRSNINEDSDYDTCANLADSYINGWCCEPDLIKGYYWTAIAYRIDDISQKVALKALAKKMDKPQIRQARELF